MRNTENQQNKGTQAARRGYYSPMCNPNYSSQRAETILRVGLKTVLLAWAVLAVLMLASVQLAPYWFAVALPFGFLGGALLFVTKELWPGAKAEMKTIFKRSSGP